MNKIPLTIKIKTMSRFNKKAIESAATAACKLYFFAKGLQSQASESEADGVKKIADHLSEAFLALDSLATSIPETKQSADWRKQRNYYLIYSIQMLKELGFGLSESNLAHQIIREVKGYEKIEFEFKYCTEDQRKKFIKDYNVTPAQFDAYLQANCATLIFPSFQAVKAVACYLLKLGAKSPMFIAPEYRQVITEQALFHATGAFSQKFGDL